MSDDKSLEHEMFVTEFPKMGFGIVDYLQGRMNFSIMDQMKLMHKSGMSPEENNRKERRDRIQQQMEFLMMLHYR